MLWMWKKNHVLNSKQLLRHWKLLNIKKYCFKIDINTTWRKDSMLHNVRINLTVETKDKRFKLLKFDEKKEEWKALSIPRDAWNNFQRVERRAKSKVNLHGFTLLKMHKILFPFLFSRSWNRFLDCGAIILNNFFLLLHPFFFFSFTYVREYEEIFSSGKFYFEFIFYLKFSFFFFLFFKPTKFLAGFLSLLFLPYILH